LSYGRSIP